MSSAPAAPSPSCGIRPESAQSRSPDMGQWTGAGLSTGTTVTNANSNNAGNANLLSGESLTVSSSGTNTAVINAGGGVDITGASGSVFRWNFVRNGSKFGAA